METAKVLEINGVGEAVTKLMNVCIEEGASMSFEE